MGSLGSRPTPPAPQPSTPVVYVPAPTPSADPAPSGPDAAAQRRENLLRRGRGRFGTVLTSFRGLLGLADTSGQRKTLLGE